MPTCAISDAPIEWHVELASSQGNALIVVRI